jgi:NAD+ diphosphatase
VKPLAPLALGRFQANRNAQLRLNEAELKRLRHEGKFLQCTPGSLHATESSLLLTADIHPELHAAYLGENNGEHYFVYLEFFDPALEHFKNIRSLAPLLSDLEVGLAATALALVNWHTTHKHCPRCGAFTEITQGGWSRWCDTDATEHYPRTDPVIIVGVIDAQDRILLARQSVWKETDYSIVAGFVEAGETLESAVLREVLEETSIQIDEITYLGNQPWPFPASLMLGFSARALTTDIAVDGSEIAEAHWFSQAEIHDACERGEVRIPAKSSIARKIIEAWYESEMPDTWTRT